MQKKNHPSGLVILQTCQQGKRFQSQFMMTTLGSFQISSYDLLSTMLALDRAAEVDIVAGDTASHVG